MKKAVSILLALVISLSTLGVYALAADSFVNTYVTIADGSGAVVLPYASVKVRDIDSDGKLTVNDALYCAHEQYYTGGAAAGYATSTSQYGMGMDKLWGDDANGLQAFGYYLNDSMAENLQAEIKADDYVAAFVYSDSANWSDKYAFFNIKTVSAVKNKEVELTLYKMDYDENWNPVALPFAGASITIDGEAIPAKTDANGRATVKIPDAGTHIISAKSLTATLAAPVCVAEVVYSRNTFFNWILTVLNRIIDSITAFFK